MRYKNISEGFMSGGVFHPIRAAGDYKAKRAGEKKKYATGKKAKPSKAAKTVRVPHKRVAAKKTVAQLKAALKAKSKTARTRNPVSRGVLENYDAQKQLTLYDSIKTGKSVTIRTRTGTTRSGVATMRGPTGWVLTPRTHTGNPPIAYPGNIVSVRAGKLPVANPLPVGKYIKAKVKRCADGTVKVLITGTR